MHASGAAAARFLDQSAMSIGSVLGTTFVYWIESHLEMRFVDEACSVIGRRHSLSDTTESDFCWKSFRVPLRAESAARHPVLIRVRLMTVRWALSLALHVNPESARRKCQGAGAPLPLALPQLAPL